MPARERRYILRSLFTPGSVKFWNLSTHHARVVYMALVVNADDNGCVECGLPDVLAMIPRWNPVELIKPESNENQTARGGFRGRYKELGDKFKQESTAEAIKELKNVRLIRRYRADGKWYAEVNGFVQSQSGKEVKWEEPKIPEPPDGFQLHEKPPLLSKLSKEDRKIESLFGDAGKTFADAKRRFRRIVGRNFGSLGQREREWSGFVASVGAEMALAALELWAKENKDWLKAECKNPLTNFLKNKSDMVEAVEIERERAASAPSGEPNEELSDEEFNRREHERLFGAKESDHPLKKGTVQ